MLLLSQKVNIQILIAHFYQLLISPNNLSEIRSRQVVRRKTSIETIGTLHPLIQIDNLLSKELKVS